MASPGAGTPKDAQQINQARPDRVQAARALLSSTVVRVKKAADYRKAGEHINLRQLPRVRGDWKWLEPEDDTFARALGYGSPLDVTLARVQGHLTDAVDTRTPGVRFIPDIRYFNPDSQPTSRGQWEYYTPDSENLAHLNFGQAAQHGLQNVPRQTAEQIWQVRESFMTEDGDFGTTADIDLVWIPRSQIGTSASDADCLNSTPANASPAPSRPSLPPATSASPSPTHNLQDAPFGADAWSGLAHDPTNGGANNQTGGNDRARYFTITIKNRTSTMDTSVARTGDEEPHKGWALTQTGGFKRWEHYDEVDWDDQDSIKWLNKWRHQHIRRTFKRDIRKKPCLSYTPKQKDRLWAEIEKREGGRLTGKEFAKLCDEFNQTWPPEDPDQARKPSGISSIIARMAKEWEKNGGKRTKHDGRGEKKRRQRLQREAEEARQKDEASDGDAEVTMKREDDDSQGGEDDGDVENEDDEDVG